MSGPLPDGAAGIRVFVTGGLGGVHRDGHRTLDISADLTELATTDVAVISAGVKSILDIGLTLEALETLRVPVLAYRTDEFPAFFSRTSGHQAPARVDSPEEIDSLELVEVVATRLPFITRSPADL